jgi:polysaccharide transporter, PST family
VNSIWTKYLPRFVARRLDGRYGAQKVVANTAWLFAEKIVRMAVGVVIGIWIARYLGAEQFGLLSYAVAFVGLFGTVATLGIDGVVVRELVRDPGHKDEILGTAFMAKLGGGILTFLLAMAGILLLRRPDSVVQGLVAIIAAGTVVQSFDVIDFWFQSRVESRFGVVAKASVFLFVSAVKVALILNQAPLFAFALAASLEILLAAAGLIVAYRMSGQHLSAWSVNAKRVRQLFRDSWPLALASMAVMIYMKIDLIMLGQLLGDRAVGVYSAAIRLSEVWYFIPVSIVASVTPSLIVARKVDMSLYYKRLANLFRLLMGIALAIAIPMTFASGYVARAAYGQGYEGAAQVLAVHIWAVPFVFLGVAQSPWNLNEGMTRFALLKAILGALTNIVLNFLLIPRFGPVGAAISTTVSYALSGVFLNAFNSRARRIFLLQLNAMILMPTKR